MKPKKEKTLVVHFNLIIICPLLFLGRAKTPPTAIDEVTTNIPYVRKTRESTTEQKFLLTLQHRGISIKITLHNLFIRIGLVFVTCESIGHMKI